MERLKYPRRGYWRKGLAKEGGNRIKLTDGGVHLQELGH